MYKKTKFFNLISGAENSFSWHIDTRIYENGSFKCKGTIQIRDNNEYYQKNKEYYEEYRLNNKEYMREYQNKYKKTSNGREAKMKGSSKQRGLGYMPLNEWKEGDCQHHINDEHVVFIPKEIHEKYSGTSLENHRKLIMDWLYDNDLDLWLILFGVKKDNV